MSNEMIERVAKAIARQQGYGNVVNCHVWWEQAKAAIAAMREPTEEMIDNIGKVVVNQDGFAKPIVMSYEVRQAYQSMIDAALKE